MASSSLVASSSVPQDPLWEYDVFLNFRGETRHSFTAHLYDRLLSEGIKRTFLDEEALIIGRPVSDIFSAIEQSRLAILVISPNYASSKWCMNELLKILKCMEKRNAVLPIFYSVEPGHVGKRLGDFGKAFTKIEQEFKKEKEMVEEWKSALRTVAKTKGWTSKDRNEAELIKEIVEKVRNEVGPMPLYSAKPLVGIDSKLEQLDLLLAVESSDVHFVGIWGMSGIGKTTLAKEVYYRNLHKFGVKSFLERVGEVSKASGPVELQSYLRKPKVLLILDGVDHVSQLEKLCGNRNWFGPGSRIIITTTKEDLLISHGVRRRFKVLELNDDDALKLFSLRAFNSDYPPKSHKHLSVRFVNYAKGHPLALDVLGSHLCEKDQYAWSSQLRKLEECFDENIMRVLKTNYDELDKQQKSVFLDIACFLKGEYKHRVFEILDGCGFHPGIDLDVLMKRSLITISDNMVLMHDLIQEMGREIVHLQSPEPGKRSRLWISKDIFHVLRENTGTEAIEGIVLDFLESKTVECLRDAFSKMFNLRMLKLHNVRLPQGLNFLPKSLRFLDWKDYPLPYLPSGFESDELVELSMCNSSIEQLWNGIKNFDNLKVIKVSHSKSLIRTPNFEGVQNLETLDLEGCESLVEIHSSIGVLKKLVFLTLKDCKSLVLLPDDIEHLTSLSLLDLRDCKKLNSLPSTIGSLKAIKSLNVSGCSNLVKLPESVGKLEFLEKIDVSGTAITEWPPSIVRLENLKSLIFRGTEGPSRIESVPKESLHQPMSSFLPPLSGFRSLIELDLSDQNLWEGAIANEIGCLSSMVSLNLSGNNFVSLPTSISQLSKLENLCVSRCKRLQHLPVLSSDVNLEVTADDCTSLEMLQCPSNVDSLNSSHFNFINCERYNHIAFTMLQRYVKRASYAGDRYEIVIPGTEIPGWFTHKRMGPSVSIALTPHWRDKWMGYALCAVFEVSGCGWELSCVLEINGKEVYPAPLLSTNVQPMSDHLWLFYVSRDICFGTEWQNSCDQLIFSFKGSGPCLVKTCGACLVYKQDVKEFSRTVTATKINTRSYEAMDDQSVSVQGVKPKHIKEFSRRVTAQTILPSEVPPREEPSDAIDLVCQEGAQTLIELPAEAAKAKQPRATEVIPIQIEPISLKPPTVWVRRFGFKKLLKEDKDKFDLFWTSTDLDEYWSAEPAPFYNCPVRVLKEDIINCLDDTKISTNIVEAFCYITREKEENTQNGVKNCYIPAHLFGSMDTAKPGSLYFKERITMMREQLETQIGIAANIFFPLCIQEHFTLLVFDTVMMEFVHYNSIRSPEGAVQQENLHFRMARKVKEYVVEWMREKSSVVSCNLDVAIGSQEALKRDFLSCLDPHNEFEVRVSLDCPHQRAWQNSCGLYIIYYMINLAKGDPIPSTPYLTEETYKSRASVVSMIINHQYSWNSKVEAQSKEDEPQQK